MIVGDTETVGHSPCFKGALIQPSAIKRRYYMILMQFYLLLKTDFRERGEGGKRERNIICCSTYLGIQGLILVFALTWYWTCNLDILGCSNPLSYPARAIFVSKLKFLPFDSWWRGGRGGGGGGWWGLGRGGIEQKVKRTHGHGQQCADCWGERGIRGLNGNGKIQ